MLSLYCPIVSTSCQHVDCDEASDFMSNVECVCLTEQELQLIHDRITANAAEIAKLWRDQLRQDSEMKSYVTSKLIPLQEQITQNRIDISNLQIEDSKIWAELDNLGNNLDNLYNFSHGFLQNWAQSNSEWISRLHTTLFGSQGDINDLDFRVDMLESNRTELYDKVANNALDIQKIYAALYANKIFVQGVTDGDIPDFGIGGGATSGDCENCVMKNENNYISGDMIFSGNVELINRDLELRYPFPKGRLPDTKKTLSILIRDNEGNVTSDNVHAFSGSIDTDGTVQTYLRGYRYNAGSIEHCDFVLRVPRKGECYCWTQNLRLGCMKEEGADSDASAGCGCGDGWLDVCGDATIWEDLEVKQEVHINTEGGTTIIEGPTHIYNTFEVEGDSHFHENVTIDNSVHVGGSITVEGSVDSNLGGGAGGGTGGVGGGAGSANGYLFTVRGFCCRDFYASGTNSLKNIFEVFQCATGWAYQAMGTTMRAYGGLDFMPCSPSSKVIQGHKVTPGITFSKYTPDGKGAEVKCGLSKSEDEFGHNRIYFDRFYQGKRHRWILGATARKLAEKSSGFEFVELQNDGFFIATGSAFGTGSPNQKKTYTIPFKTMNYKVATCYEGSYTNTVAGAIGGARTIEELEDRLATQLEFIKESYNNGVDPLTSEIQPRDGCSCDLGSIWSAISQIQQDISKIKQHLINTPRPLCVVYNGDSFTITSDIYSYSFIVVGYADETVDRDGQIPAWFFENDPVVPDTPEVEQPECKIEKPVLAKEASSDENNIRFTCSYNASGTGGNPIKCKWICGTDNSFSTTVSCTSSGGNLTGLVRKQELVRLGWQPGVLNMLCVKVQAYSNVSNMPCGVATLYSEWSDVKCYFVSI